jgi:hypothetical protein
MLHSPAKHINYVPGYKYLLKHAETYVYIISPRSAFFSIAALEVWPWLRLLYYLLYIICIIMGKCKAVKLAVRLGSVFN